MHGNHLTCKFMQGNHIISFLNENVKACFIHILHMQEPNNLKMKILMQKFFFLDSQVSSENVI